MSLVSNHGEEIAIILARFLAEHYGCPPNSRDYCDCATCDPDAPEAEHLATSAKCWIRIAEDDVL